MNTEREPIFQAQIRRSRTLEINGDSKGILGPSHLERCKDTLFRLQQLVRKKSLQGKFKAHFRAYDGRIFLIEWTEHSDKSFHIQFNQVIAEDAPLPKATMELGKKEQLIAQLVAEGKSNSEAARISGVSINTVRSQIQRIFRKLGVANRLDLTKMLHGLTVPPKQEIIQDKPRKIKSKPKTPRSKGFIITVLNELRLGTPFREICRKYKIGQEQLNLWHYKYASLPPERLKELYEVVEENKRLIERVMDLEEKLKRFEANA